jgi:O-acetylserine/cysteine efflux transporter
MPGPTSGDEPHSLAPRDFVLLVIINLIWGFNLIASKVGVGEIPPIIFTALRFLILSILLAPLLRVVRGGMATLLAASAMSGALPFGLMYYGLSRAEDVSAIAVATQLGVPFSALLSVWLLGERIRWRRKVGIALSFLGIVVIAFDPRVMQYVDGLAFVIASTFVGSVALILMKRLRGIGVFELQAWIATTSWPLLLALSVILERDQVAALRRASWLAWAALAFTALAASLIAHSGLYHLIRRYPVTTVSPLTVMTPIFGIVFGVSLLGDQLTPRMLAGGALTLCGVVIVASRGRRIVATAT